MLLLFPPAAKGCEPPGGIALLGGALKSHNINYKIIDMNIEALNFLLDGYFKAKPKKEHYRNLIRDKNTYTNMDRYTKVVNELSMGLNYNQSKDNQLSLSNYVSEKYNPLISSDLLNAAEQYKDSPFYDYYIERLRPIFLNESFTEVGISIQFLNQAIPAFSLIGLIKDNFKGVKVVLGGGLITSWTRSSVWKNPFSQIVDKIISGPGEVSLIEYLGYNPDTKALRNCLPDFEFTGELDYFSPGKIIPVSGSIGCSWKKCTFCPEQTEDNPFIFKGKTRILEELKRLKEIYKPGLFHFLDNEITPSVLNELANNNIGVPWYGFTKFYNILKDVNFCIKLKKSGCRMLKLGLESGDQNVLNSMNKGIDLEDVTIILENLKAAGISTFIYLLFGTPEEDYESAKKTLSFILKHSAAITYLNLAIFNMPIDSSISKSVETFGFSNADLSLYSGFRHPKGWNRDVVRSFLNKEFKSAPEVKIILKRTPPVFNSNHSPFFLF